MKVWPDFMHIMNLVAFYKHTKGFDHKVDVQMKNESIHFTRLIKFNGEKLN